MKKYYYIQAWGMMMGSFSYYIKNQVALAEADNAPANATSRNQDGTWSTIDDCKNEEIKQQVTHDAEALRKRMEVKIKNG